MGKSILIVVALAVLAISGWTMIAPQPDISADGEGGALVSISIPELKGNEKVGKQVFDAKCIACHGENATGVDGAGPPLVHIYYEPSHHGDAAFMLAVRNGVRQHHWDFGNMPPVQGLSGAEVNMIVQYIRALQRENGIS